MTTRLEPITTSTLYPPFPPFPPFPFFLLNTCTFRFIVLFFVGFKNSFCSLYQVIPISIRKNVNKYLYLLLTQDRTPLVRLVVDLLYSKLYDFVECCGLVVQLFKLLKICCGFCCGRRLLVQHTV